VETKTVKLSSSCRLEVDFWDTGEPDAQIVYTEHQGFYEGSSESTCSISTDEAQEMINVLQAFIYASRKAQSKNGASSVS
jgi:hypothetical protein